MLKHPCFFWSIVWQHPQNNRDLAEILQFEFNIDPFHGDTFLFSISGETK